MCHIRSKNSISVNYANQQQAEEEKDPVETALNFKLNLIFVVEYILVTW